MAELRIETRDNQTSFKPGDIVEGTVVWRVDRVKSAVLRLLWRTQGKGTQDVGMHAEISFDTPGEIDKRTFRFTLPPGPLSYDGKLIAIIWGLELELVPGEVASLDIVVSS